MLRSDQETYLSAEGKISTDLTENIRYLKERLSIEENYDIVYRSICFGGRNAALFFIDGFCKGDLLQKILQYLMDLPSEKMPEDAHELSKCLLPYMEVDLQDEWEKIISFILAGIFVIFVDGYRKCLLIDARSYPSRSVTEPEKDKALRGSKDGFVETLVSNTALIRRRIRSCDLRMEYFSAGRSSHTDIVLCYMNSRADQAFLERIRQRIREIDVDALTMNQESLAECLYKRKWYNPFPKFKFTERPDTAAAQILEGDIVILVDNSPSAMITPTTIFDVIDEADDYYFPPITGTYLRLTRFLIAILTYLVTPTFFLLINHPGWIPEAFRFILIKDVSNIPVFWQFMILELSIDGLKLAAVNTPNMLSTPLSVMAALVLGEFAVNSGWFNSEVLLYMAFVAIANYTQASYELGYAIKFMRILNLILTALFGVYGYIAGILILICAIASNKTVSGKSYLYPLMPFKFSLLWRRFIRTRMPGAKK